AGGPVCARLAPAGCPAPGCGRAAGHRGRHRAVPVVRLRRPAVADRRGLDAGRALGRQSGWFPLMRALFMAGTDTGVGKTHVAVALGRALRAAGIDAVGMKPVASGCVPTPGGWRNDDALALLAAGGLPAGDYALVNPVALPRPQSPHLAACAQ